MIKLSHPEFLYFFLAIPPLIIFILRSENSRRRIISKLFDSNLKTQLLPLNHVRPRKISNVLIVVIFVLAILATLGPSFGTYTEKATKHNIAIAIALDISHSMLAEDVEPNRLERAKSEIQVLISRLEGNLVSLILFSSQALILCPATSDYGALRTYLESVTTEMSSSGGSSLLNGIQVAYQSLRRHRERGSRAIVVFSDGEDHTDSQARQEFDPGADVRVYPICIGTNEPTRIPMYGEKFGFKTYRGNIVLSRARTASMRELGLRYGGVSYEVNSAESKMDELYRELLSNASIEETQETREFADRFQTITLVLIALALGRVVWDRRKLGK